ncbi:YfiR family protein [Methylosoma difficile]
MLILGCLGFSQQSYAEDAKTVEYKIKAAYIYNFTKFITWLDDGLPEFNLCVLGVDPFGETIVPIEQRTVAERPIRIQRYPSFTKFFNSGTKAHCHIIFISAAIGNPLFIKNVENTLVIGDSPNFAEKGGMIGFVKNNNKIKLQINLDAVKRGGLKVSAKLLEVAEIVKDDNHD